MSDDDETQAIHDAQETRKLVIAAVLLLAGRVIEHVDRHEGVALAQLAEDLPAGGFTWQLAATYSQRSDFVRVQAAPVVTDRVTVSIEEMARIMGNETARFDTQVPREWVELAIVGSSESSFLSAPRT